MKSVINEVVLREFFLYYKSTKRELQTRPINECRCDERLKSKVEESTRLTYTGLLGALEHLIIYCIMNQESETPKDEDEINLREI
jgi:hypothetical protein